MIENEEAKAFSPVAICVPSTTLTRFVLFEMSFNGLRVPPYSMQYRIVSTSPAKNRNDAIRMATLEITHFFFIDDDQHFDQDLLLRMLSWRVPVVCALTCLARPPFFPILFKGDHTLPDGRKRYENISWAELDNKHGLYPIFAGPGSGILVERAVLDRMPQPWFEIGKYDPEQLQEDVVFYEKCRNLGVPIYCDLDSPMGHIAPTVAWPVRTSDDRWTIELMWENGQKFMMGRSDGAGWPAGKPPAGGAVVPQ